MLIQYISQQNPPKPTVNIFCFPQPTQKVKVHEPCGYAYKVVTDFEEYSRPVVVYRDSGSGDVAENFILSLCEEYERLEPLLQMEEEMNLTEAEEGTHFAASRCYLCHEPLDNKSKTRDHCHYTLV